MEIERDLSLGEALDLGVQRALAGDHKTAAGLFRAVMMHDPDNFEARVRLGVSLFELGGQLHYEALFHFWRCVKMDRRSSMALMNYGLCLGQLGYPEEGLPFLERAFAIAEKSPEASSWAKAMICNNLGNALERIGRDKEALFYLDKGLSYDATDPFPHYNRGIALIRLNRHQEAIAAFDRSLSLRSTSEESGRRLEQADAYYNRAMARLILGDLKDGFADYEYRLLTSENIKEGRKLNMGFPPEKKWDGKLSWDKPLLVVVEQGLGDTIQFLRFLPALRERGEIILAVQEALRPMVEDSFPGLKTVSSGTIMNNDDYSSWVALMSLPHYLGLEHEDDIPGAWAPWIDPALIEKYAAPSPRPRVGICWTGNWQHKNDKDRSIPLSQFASLFDAPVDFVSVQQMRPGEEAEFAVLQAKHPNLTALTLTDFRDTAAVMMNLDLMIAVDTSVAHMAATLCVPTWILVPEYGTDWRWQKKRTDSPWYSTARLYRQHRVHDWGGALSDVKRDLLDLCQKEAA